MGKDNTEEELAEISRIIYRAHGPSGSNMDYLVKLKESLDLLGISDDHVNSVFYACIAVSNES